jgi:preprotein translocase subunit SecD
MIPHEEHKDQLFNEMREIWQQRLDPRGVREIPIRREGENRIVIELPGSAAQMNDAGHRESENFRERIEELEQRIEELEELLERVRGRRNR